MCHLRCWIVVAKGHLIGKELNWEWRRERERFCTYLIWEISLRGEFVFVDPLCDRVDHNLY